MGIIRAKKALGQNFLVDGNVIDNIIKAAQAGAEENVLEVGPGRGALTSLLSEKAAQVVAVEWDRDLVPLLKEGVGSRANVEVVHGDILRVDLPGLLLPVRQGRWKVVANLPYNISSQVLFKFIENRPLFSELILMLQKEVGERLLAPPSTKEYGVLTVLCRLVFDIEKVFLVKPSSFRPIPKVDSIVLRFRVLPTNRLDVGDEKLFRIIVKASFSQRRKTLWNCLKSIDLLSEPNTLEQVFEKSGIDKARRGETLSLQEFADLTRTVAALFDAGAGTR
ncbi:MAG: 16S rRNA (adenine(1518)-N(6)/adenine(1519)-N(6))-dimethyltransferase RsmA [Deltaproteobacteria bacterium]|nr:16S rRNA (adenine(1518)-N(6)/adenine(1519)-N(6))-dimethyltransferase RsmA [Deltaproteobacteria bacterium]TLN04762.1 MAG: 16S rRNA (adenine(1518)-N(6)/adenine(1519)-N(6))-dimethyltransferase RsmA [bacterium]